MRKYSGFRIKEISSKYDNARDFFINDMQYYFWCIYRNLNTILDDFNVKTEITNEDFEMVFEKLPEFENESIEILIVIIDEVLENFQKGLSDYDEDSKQIFINLLSACNKEIRIRKLKTIS